MVGVKDVVENRAGGGIPTGDHPVVAYVPAVRCTAEGNQRLKHLFELYKAKSVCGWCKRKKDQDRKDCEGCGAAYETVQTDG